MLVPLGYLEVLLIIVAASLVLIGIFIYRDRWNSKPTRLRLVLGQTGPTLASGDAETLAPILLYEEQYSAFTNILGLVLAHFSLRRLRSNQRFRDNLDFLAQAINASTPPEQLQGAMCQVIHALLEDPDVEYACRPELDHLIDRFLAELETRSRSSPARRSA